MTLYSKSPHNHLDTFCKANHSILPDVDTDQMFPSPTACRPENHTDTFSNNHSILNL